VAFVRERDCDSWLPSTASRFALRGGTAAFVEEWQAACFLMAARWQKGLAAAWSVALRDEGYGLTDLDGTGRKAHLDCGRRRISTAAAEGTKIVIPGYRQLPTAERTSGLMQKLHFDCCRRRTSTAAAEAEVVLHPAVSPLLSMLDVDAVALLYHNGDMAANRTFIANGEVAAWAKEELRGRMAWATLSSGMGPRR
jgi:hypothetical protein